MVPRIGFEDLPSALHEALRPRVERLGFLGEFFQTAAHQPEALLGFVQFTESLKAALPPRLTQTVALTVATRCGNDYERVQHERLCRTLGLDDAWIDAVERLDPADASLTPTEQAVQALALRLVDGHGEGAAAEMKVASELLTPDLLVGVLLTVGRYLAHAVFVNALGIEPPP